MKDEPNIRQPIVTVVGHVDHGKTSILDRFRGSSVQKGEAGGITQKISFTKYPYEQMIKSCPLIKNQGVAIDIPGFLFIDTPGHAAFTNLRKRGGSLADLAILVVSIKDGIQPQTAEVLQILKTYKTPFLIALNKVDTISGWKREKNLKYSIEHQAINVEQEFQEALLTFQGALKEYGFDSNLYYDVEDFTKEIAIVPCSAKTGEGISELLFVLCGLCQRFLKERLKMTKDAKGVVLEVKKEKGMESVESILYDGVLKTGDEIAIASFGEPIVSKVRAIEEVLPLSFKFKSADKVTAATGVRLQLTNKGEGILSGMIFQKIQGNLDEISKALKKEVSSVLELDKEGIVIKADSLGSLEALVALLKQENIKIVRAGIGPIGKADISAAKANLEINEMDAIVLGFNVGLEYNLDVGKVKVLTHPVVYKLIEDLKEWRAQKGVEIERERMMGLATICKLEVLHNYVFRNSNPAIFGVKVLAGKVKVGIPLMDENGVDVARVKSLQDEKESVREATEGQELAIALPGVTFDRRMKDVSYLYSRIGGKQIKEFRDKKDLLSGGEIKVLGEIADIREKASLRKK